MSSRNSMFQLNTMNAPQDLSNAVVSKQEPLYIRPKLTVRFPSVVKKENRPSNEKPSLASQISVMDMATNGISNLRNKDDTLPGYSIPKWNHDREIGRAHV